MQLLGHQDISMTLRYLQVTQHKTCSVNSTSPAELSRNVTSFPNLHCPTVPCQAAKERPRRALRRARAITFVRRYLMLRTTAGPAAARFRKGVTFILDTKL